MRRSDVDPGDGREADRETWEPGRRNGHAPGDVRGRRYRRPSVSRHRRGACARPAPSASVRSVRRNGPGHRGAGSGARGVPVRTDPHDGARGQVTARRRPDHRAGAAHALRRGARTAPGPSGSGHRTRRLQRRAGGAAGGAGGALDHGDGAERGAGHDQSDARASGAGGGRLVRDDLVLFRGEGVPERQPRPRGVLRRCERRAGRADRSVDGARPRRIAGGRMP